MESKSRKFRKLLGEPGAVLMPVAHDAITAKIIEKLGYKTLAVGGFATAAVNYGLPDLGLIGLKEIAEATKNISSAVDLPILADADGGYGNEVNMSRTIRELEISGAAAIFIEDQEHPKRCGHLDGKILISKENMVRKIKSALKSRAGSDLVIIARTDAIAVEGLESAIDRAHAYAEAGCDVIFVEAPRSKEELARIANEIKEVPLLVNMLDGGKTPILSKAELEKMGYKIIAYPVTTLLASIKAIEAVLEKLKRDGSTENCKSDLCDMNHFRELVDLKGWLDRK
ncbi:MAG TPA: oxaloacetate decarboxylase [archaeon]|nr:oxaloacetate decarboxylase [archaeon]